MESKTTIQAIVAMLIALAVWLLVVNVILPPQPRPELPETEQPAPSGPSGEVLSGEEPSIRSESEVFDRSDRSPFTPSIASGADESSEYEVGGAESRGPIALGDASRYRSGPYRMWIEFDQRGASIRQVLLTDYLEKVTPKDRVDQAARLALMGPVTDQRTNIEYLSMTTRTLTLLDEDPFETIKLDEVRWEVTEPALGEGGQTVRFRVPIRRGGRDFLVVEKEFELPASTLESGRHDLNMIVRVRNVSDRPVSFTLQQDGPTGIPREGKRTDERSIFSGTLVADDVEVERHDRGSLTKKEWTHYHDGQSDPLAWIALSNKYFMALMSPAVDEGNAFGDLIASAHAFPYTTNGRHQANDDLGYQFKTSPQVLQPGQDLAFKFSCYLGPKTRHALEGNTDYAERHYIYALEKGYRSCAFVGLARLMVRLLEFFHRVCLGNYGLAVIVLVLIVRTILHPVTKRGQVNMVKMQTQMSEVQPKMEEIKKKYANDKTKLNQETMALYREAGLSPVGQVFTCLPMFLQMPIWIALWTTLNYTVEMRHEPFILWIRDLTGPDAINLWFGWHFEPFSIPLLSGMIGEVDSLNVLPIVLSATMYFQQRFMPKAAQANKKGSKTPDQLAQQQKIMNIMMVFFGVLFYNAPAGLNLYIMSSNVFGMIEQWRIRKHIAEEKEKGTFAIKPKKTGKGGKPRFWARLERMADNAKRVQSPRQGKRKLG